MARGDGAERFTRPRKGARVRNTIGMRAKVLARRGTARLSGERGAAETSTILAWIVVGVLVVFALRSGLEEAGTQVIDWVKSQFANPPGP